MVSRARVRAGGPHAGLQTVTGEDIDAKDSFALLRRLTAPKTWQSDEGAEPLDVAEVRRAQVPPPTPQPALEGRTCPPL